MARLHAGGPAVRALFIPVLIGLALIALALGGCAETPEGSTVVTQQPLGGESNALLTSADVRVVTTSTPQAPLERGRIRPAQITCIEPSPDIAKAVHENFSLGASGGIGGLPSGISADVAFAFAKARAEAVAQMTERLATIQLLRDGLYRACEAYANGAISDTAYAVLLSRYDDTMVTLLMGELAAGNFGRKQAALGGSTGGSSSALLEKAAADEKAASQATGDAAEADETVAQRQRELGAVQERQRATAADDPNRAAVDAEVSASQARLDAAKAEQALLRKRSDELLRSAASSSATALAQAGGGSAAGGTPGAQDRAALAAHLANMQRKYIENINSDALVVACISALDRPAAKRGNVAALAQPGMTEAAFGVALAASYADLSPLASYCLSGLLPKVLGGYQDILATLKSRSLLDHDLNSIDTAIDAVKHYSEQLEALETVLNGNQKLSGTPGGSPSGGAGGGN